MQIVSSPSDGTTKVVLTNRLGFTQRLDAGMDVGTVGGVEVVESEIKVDGGADGVGLMATEGGSSGDVKVWTVGGEGLEGGSVGTGGAGSLKREMLRAQLDGSVLTDVERDQLDSLLLEFQEVFSTEKGERGRNHRIGDWVLVRFPQEESGRQRKLSRPWHGPYRVTERHDPDVTVVKIYFPEKGPIQVHQSRVCPCPFELPAGFYWYGGDLQEST